MEKNNKSKKRLAFLIGTISGHGGIERVTSVLTREILKNDNIEIHLIGYHPCDDEKMVFEWDKKLSFFDLLASNESMKTGIFKAIPRLRTYLKKENIDVLICCGHIYGPLSSFSTLWTKTKLIYWSHLSFYGVHDNKFKKLNERFTSLFTNVVVTLTKADKSNYEKKTWAKKVAQIYNPVDKDLLKSSSTYHPNTKKIISVGRLDIQKNFHDILPEVAEKVLKKHSKYTWHIYGKGVMEDKAFENIRKRGLEKKVILEGNVDNLYDLYNDYSILVMTSSYEGFPMSLLEGMAKKLPLVSFDIPTGPNEIIEDGKNGFLIPAFDVDLMAKKIEALILSREQRISCSKYNESIIDNFRLEHIALQWTKLFQEM